MRDTANRRKVLIGVPAVGLAAAASSSIGALADEPNPLKSAYDAWREADDRATEICMAVDLAEPRCEQVQMTHPSPDDIEQGRGRVIFWPLSRHTIDTLREDLTHPGRPQTPERLLAVSTRLTDLEIRLHNYEAECRAIAERHGLPEAEQRRREAKAALLTALATAIGATENEAVDMCDALSVDACERAFG